MFQTSLEADLVPCCALFDAILLEPLCVLPAVIRARKPTNIQHLPVPGNLTQSAMQYAGGLLPTCVSLHLLKDVTLVPAKVLHQKVARRLVFLHCTNLCDTVLTEQLAQNPRRCG